MKISSSRSKLKPPWFHVWKGGGMDSQRSARILQAHLVGRVRGRRARHENIQFPCSEDPRSTSCNMYPECEPQQGTKRNSIQHCGSGRRARDAVCSNTPSVDKGGYRFVVVSLRQPTIHQHETEVILSCRRQPLVTVCISSGESAERVPTH